MLKPVAAEAFRIQPMTGYIGAEIFDLKLDKEQPETVWQGVRQALTDYGVLFIHDQDIEPQHYMDFAGRFGTVVRTPMAPHLEGFEKIADMRMESNEKGHSANIWHVDSSTYPHPVRATFLLGREIPAVGGDTCFISTAHAYEALSDGLKHTLQGLRTVHSDLPAARRYNKAKATVVPDWEIAEAVHPVVIRLPESGKPALYVNPLDTVRFEGWTEEESDGLLKYLYQHCNKPEFTCRFRWSRNALCVIDNYQTWHYAVDDYYGYRRVLHRTMVEADMYQ